MKRVTYLVLLLAVAFGSFLGGSLFNRREGDKNTTVHPSVEGKSAYTREPQEDSAMPPGTVRINAEKQQVVGIRVGQVKKQPVTHTLRLLGRVAPDETRTYFINATVDGWITEALSNTTGSFVRKDETLATFYSPEFLSAAQALLFALSSKDRVQTTGEENPAQKSQIAQFEINLKQYRDSLRNLGMGNLQIEEMIRRRKYIENVDIVSPADGFILSRNISQGLRFDKGRELYRIADLSRVWILADVFEYEAQFFKAGAMARVFLPYQKRTCAATVSKVPPTFDAATRTLKVRLEMTNPDFTLRPDMFVDVELAVQLPPTLTVPADAVLDSGMRKTVFVDRGNGFFEPRKVEIGWRLGNRIEIIKGLTPGERIVTSGNFLIDSESRLQAVAQGIYGESSTDPVCGMEVDEFKSRATGKTSLFRGKTYAFCSRECKEQFDKNPGQFEQEVSTKRSSSSRTNPPGRSP